MNSIGFRKKKWIKYLKRFGKKDVLKVINTFGPKKKKIIQHILQGGA